MSVCQPQNLWECSFLIVVINAGCITHTWFISNIRAQSPKGECTPVHFQRVWARRGRKHLTLVNFDLEPQKFLGKSISWNFLCWNYVGEHIPKKVFVPEGSSYGRNPPSVSLSSQTHLGNKEESFLYHCFPVKPCNYIFIYLIYIYLSYV